MSDKTETERHARLAKERERQARARGFKSVDALHLYELEESLEYAKAEVERVAGEVQSIEEQIAEARAKVSA